MGFYPRSIVPELECGKRVIKASISAKVNVGDETEYCHRVRDVPYTRADGADERYRAVRIDRLPCSDAYAARSSRPRPIARQVRRADERDPERARSDVGARGFDFDAFKRHLDAGRCDIDFGRKEPLVKPNSSSNAMASARFGCVHPRLRWSAEALECKAQRLSTNSPITKALNKWSRR